MCTRDVEGGICNPFASKRPYLLIQWQRVVYVQRCEHEKDGTDSVYHGQCRYVMSLQPADGRFPQPYSAPPSFARLSLSAASDDCRRAGSSARASVGWSVPPPGCSQTRAAAVHRH